MSETNPDDKDQQTNDLPPNPLEGLISSSVISLTPSEQLAFWIALNEPMILTPAQKKLGALMRGECTSSTK